MRFPYSKSQIHAAVDTKKHPRDWEPVRFEKSGENSRRSDTALEREDGKEDRLRLTVRGRMDKPLSYQSSLLLEDQKIRGIDHHAVERRRFYREVSPKGWHEDVIDPNLVPGEKGHHQRIPLPDFGPSDLMDFLRKACQRWNIELPPTDDALL
ncbi:MAG: hypothetical protein ACI9UA_003996 [Pseudoalteromonas tetraodonis]|jgi:hypothetical protein